MTDEQILVPGTTIRGTLDDDGINVQLDAPSDTRMRRILLYRTYEIWTNLHPNATHDPNTTYVLWLVTVTLVDRQVQDIIQARTATADMNARSILRPLLERIHREYPHHS